MRGFEVGVVGVGYVGLVTGACLAHLGHRVTCVDRDADRIRDLESGRLPIYEPHLEDLMRERARHISFTTSLAGAVESSDVLFVAVDTPQRDDGSPDLSSITAVAHEIGRELARAERGERGALVVVNKSTVPVGSGDYVSALIEEGLEEAVAQREGQSDFRVVSNPEFLREGTAVYDTLYPDRIVLGSDSEAALETLRVVYGPIIERSFDPTPGVHASSVSDEPVPFVTTDLASAEMIKYAANAFLATKISFINEISNICELVGADVQSVAWGIGLDERIGPRFLNAGIGWGGSCFPKDVPTLRSIARGHDYDPQLLDATVSVNERQRKLAVTKLQHGLGTLKDKRVALLGLAFKPGTDDLRDAPSLYLARSLHSLRATVVGYDPVAGEEAQKILALSGTEFEAAGGLYEALRGAHAAVVVTEWDKVRGLDYARAAAEMEDPRLLVDGRNVLDPLEARDNGLGYTGFGRV